MGIDGISARKELDWLRFCVCSKAMIYFPANLARLAGSGRGLPDSAGNMLTPKDQLPISREIGKGTGMADPSNPIDVRRQLLQRIESMRSAGIEFLPRNVTACTNAQSSAAMAPAPVPTSSIDSPEQRRIELQQLAAVVAKCTRCSELASTRTQTVFGVGPIDVELCFVGEAPGADEDRQGEPFVGAAGQLLNRIIAAMGFKREEVFICNVLRCRPPGNRQPKADEAKNCWEYLERTLELVAPKYICTLGVPATQTLLKTTLSLTRMRGRFHDYRGIPVVCTYHPASLLPSRSPENKKLVWDDMKMLLAKMGRPVPEVKKA
jgi:uracil-DNA glycosylase